MTTKTAATIANLTALRDQLNASHHPKPLDPAIRKALSTNAGAFDEAAILEAAGVVQLEEEPTAADRQEMELWRISQALEQLNPNASREIEATYVLRQPEALGGFLVWHEDETRATRYETPAEAAGAIVGAGR